MTSEKVRYISTSVVRPATTRNVQRIELNAVDLSSLRRVYFQNDLVFSNPPAKPTNKSKQEKEINTNYGVTINQLKSSLSRTLDYFYPLAGRLAISKHDGDGNGDGASISFYINCNSTGVEFIHAEAKVTLAEILAPTYVPNHIIHSFFTILMEYTIMKAYLFHCSLLK
ncbi:hypothetical protein MKW92_012070 [Papaver armeniacum]|nr:hypothetical protein MKW92_012070 [Papaver armeniacum]